MSASYDDVFDASLDPGRFDRAGTSRLDLDHTVALELAGCQVSLPISGRLTFTLTARGHIDTWIVGRIDFDGEPSRWPNGSIVKDSHGNTVWLLPPVHEAGHEVIKPGALPQVTIGFVHEVTVTTSAREVARDLFERLEPALALRASAHLRDAAWSRYSAGLDAVRDDVLGRFPLTSFPSWGLFAADRVRDLITSGLSSGLAAEWARLAGAFRSALDVALGGLRDQLIAVADAELAALGPLAARAAALLIATGRSAAAVLTRARNLALRAVASGGSLLAAGRFWIRLLVERGGGGLAQAFADLIVTARDRWAAVEPEVRALAAELPDAGATLSSAIGVVANAPPIQAALAAYAAVLGDLCEIAGVVTRGWKRAAGVLGGLLHTFDRRGLDLGLLLQPIFATVRLRKAELIELLKFLGNDEILKKVCVWMRDHWDRVVGALSEAAGELQRVIEMIAAAGAETPPKIRQGAEAIARFLEAAGRVQRATVASTFLSQPEAWWRELEAIVRDPLGWIRAEAERRGIPPIEVARGWAGAWNPASRLAAETQPALEGLLHALAGVAEDPTVQDRARHPLEAIHDAGACVRNFARTVDDFLFAGGAITLPGGGPAIAGTPVTLEIGYHTFLPGSLIVSGATSLIGEPMLDQAAAAVTDIMGAALVDHATDWGLVEVRARWGKVAVPDPGIGSIGDLDERGRWDAVFQTPLLLPDPLIGVFWIGLLADIHILDLRYDMPYGSAAQFSVVDLDGDGLVGEHELARMRRAVGSKRASLDVDGDGEVTARDLQLAIDQTDLLVSGLMFRRVAAPVCYGAAVDEHNWDWLAIAGLSDESIPGKIERTGVVFVRDAQFALPIRALVYPLRIHLELRLYGDEFPELAPLQVWMPPENPSVRVDVIVRVGHGHGDLLVHFSAEPLNFLSRTFVFKCSGYVRGILTDLGPIVGAGVAAKLDVRLTLCYETGSPLGQVLLEWGERASAFGTELNELRLDPTKYLWELGERILDETKVRPIFRALRRLLGPLLDLLFDWTDADGRFRLCLVYLREHDLRGWSPGLTWYRLEQIVRAWPERPAGSDPGAPVVSPLVAGAAADAVRAVRDELGVGMHDACCTPQLVFDRVLAALVAMGEDPLTSLAAVKATARFQLERAGFVAGFHQLVVIEPDEPWPAEVTIPGLGRHALSGAGVATWAKPFTTPPWDDPEQLLVKPIYQSVVQIGPRCELMTAPSRAPGCKVKSLAENSLVTVEGARILVRREAHPTHGQAGDWWLFVRTASRQYGWILGADSIPLDDIVRDLGGRSCLDPELLAAAVHAAEAKPNVVAFEPSPRNTVDDTHFLGKAERTVTYTYGTGPPLPEYLSLRAKLDFALFEATDKEVLMRDPDAAVSVFGSLDHDEKQAFWSQFTADAKCAFYLPRAAGELWAIVSAILDHDLVGAWRAFVAFVDKMRDSSEQERLIAGDAMAPALRDLVVLLIEVVGMIVSKVKDVAGLVGDSAAVELAEDRVKAVVGDVFDKVKTRGPTGREMKTLLLAAAQYIRLQLPPWVRMFISDTDWTSARQDSGDDEWRLICVANGLDYEDSKDMTDKERRRWLKEQNYKYRLQQIAEHSDLSDALDADQRWRRYNQLSEKEQDALLAQQQEQNDKNSGDLVDPDTLTYTDWGFWDDGVNVNRRSYQTSRDGSGTTTSTTTDETVIGINEDGLTLGHRDDTVEVVHEDGSRTTSSQEATALSLDEDNLTLGSFAKGQSYKSGKTPKADDPDQVWSGQIAFAFGSDTLTFSYSVEEGAGGGAGAEVGSGGHITGTASYRIHGYLLKIPVRMIFSTRDTLVVALRFFVRSLLHGCDAFDDAAFWARHDQAAPGSDLLDWGRLRPIVLAGFAVIETLRDLAEDHAAFVTSILEEVHAEVVLDVNAAAIAGLSATVEVAETVKVKARIKLATIVAPLIDLLEGGRAKVDEAATVAERIVPQIAFEICDHGVVKGSSFPYAFEVETAGTLAKGSVSIPQGSRFRAAMRDIFGRVADYAEQWKASKTTQVAPGEEDPRPSKKAREILSSVDRGIHAFFLGDDLPDELSWMSADPTVTDILDVLQGRPKQATRPEGVDAQIAAACRMLRDTGLRGLEMRPGQTLLVESAGTGLHKLSVFFDDEQKARLQAWHSDEREEWKDGFRYLEPPEREAERSEYVVPLPFAPARVGWNTYTDPYDEDASWSGLIAGFDDHASAERFAAARDASWVDGRLRETVFARDGKLWCWIDTRSVASLLTASCPLPRLSQEGGALRLSFDGVPFEAPMRTGTPLFAEGFLRARTTAWKIVLVLRATRADLYTLRDVLVRNATG